jgi:hypothetical protein
MNRQYHAQPQIPSAVAAKGPHPSIHRPEAAKTGHGPFGVRRLDAAFAHVERYEPSPGSGAKYPSLWSAAARRRFRTRRAPRTPIQQWREVPEPLECGGSTPLSQMRSAPTPINGRCTNGRTRSTQYCGTRRSAREGTPGRPKPAMVSPHARPAGRPPARRLPVPRANNRPTPAKTGQNRPPRGIRCPRRFALCPLRFARAYTPSRYSSHSSPCSR